MSVAQLSEFDSGMRVEWSARAFRRAIPEHARRGTVTYVRNCRVYVRPDDAASDVYFDADELHALRIVGLDVTATEGSKP